MKKALSDYRVFIK